MTTIIIQKNKNGVITGRCDARCYNAKGKKCRCFCRGRNHGIGPNAAIEKAALYKLHFGPSSNNHGIYIKQGQLQLFE